MEDTAISPSERLRLIKVGDEIFLMASGKGVSAQLLKLDSENSILNLEHLSNGIYIINVQFGELRKQVLIVKD